MENYKFYKDGSLQRPRNIDKETYDAAEYGQAFPDYAPKDIPIKKYCFSGSYDSPDYRKVNSLKNIINYYFSTDDTFKYDALADSPISVTSLSSYHLGAGIQRGTVDVAVVSGSTVTASASDIKEDGILYDQGEKAVGIVLYKQGFILLTSEEKIINSSNEIQITGESLPQFSDSFRWHHFGASSSLDLTCSLQYSVIDDVSTHTAFIYAEKGELNHSNNATYLESGSYKYHAAPTSFIENISEDPKEPQLKIKNTVYSPINKVEAPFQKQTYITNIGLYDKNKKLIAVANLANPIKKTENREFAFKIKLDI